MFGLKAKLDALQKLGYNISSQEIDELLLWANLRNAISHALPVQFRPAPLWEEDIVEYQKFIKGLYLKWSSEMPEEQVVQQSVKRIGVILSYGYRLNVEQLLLKNANKSWLEAAKNLVSVRHSDPETAKDIKLMSPAFDDEKTISLCIESVLGWVIATEAFVNLAWQNTPSTSGLDEKQFRGTVDKIKYLCKTNEINYGSLTWRDDLVELFKLRDYLVHYKDPITYIGFSFAPKYQRDFCRKNMERYQLSVMSLMEVLGGKLGMDISFLTGEFELFYYSE